MNHVIALLVIVTPQSAIAAQAATVCDQVALQAAQTFNIPPQVMLAIARVESGRDIKGTVVPWPWAVNYGGASHWFETQEEAYAFVQREVDAGRSNIDIGCFQLNLRWHAEKFASLEEMFDPIANADYAAQFLHQNYTRKGNWVDAVAAYHSKTPKQAEVYIAKIEAVLNELAQYPLPTQKSSDRPPRIQNLFPLLKQGPSFGIASLVP